MSLPTVFTGLYDYKNIVDKKKKSLVKLHVILNTIVLSFSAFNWWVLQRTPGNIPTSRNAILGVIGLALMGYSAHIGSTIRSL
jgi:hypothetical protein